VTSSLATRESALGSGIDPFWAPLAMVLTQDLALRSYFRNRIVIGAERLPSEGPLLLAPTHRARWDALLLPMAAGRRITGRDCRFMVTRTEMAGLQGWFLHRLGCFAVDQGRPSLTTLRYAIDLLAAGQQVVVFPEGRINRTDDPIRVQQGLARLALLAQRQGVPVRVLPVGLAYSQALPRLCSQASVCFGEVMTVQGSGREAVKAFNTELTLRMQSAEQAAREAVGRPLNCR
jgi:1-acyl-sn-glycerol-3-phosphate acyltransferase